MHYSRRQFLQTSAALSALALPTFGMAASTTVRYGGSAWIGHYPAYIGWKNGAFAAEGINLEWQSFGTTSARLGALLSGDIDIACTGIVTALALMARNSKHFSIIGVPENFGLGEGVVAHAGINTVADLKGKKIGLTFASSAHILMLDLLNQAGLKESDVTLLNIPAPELLTAMQSKQIDAAVAWIPQYNMIKAIPNTKVIADDFAFSLYKTHKVAPAPDVLVVRNAFAKQNPQAVQQFLKAYYKASEALRNKPEECTTYLTALTNLPPAEQLSAIKQTEWYPQEQQKELLKVDGSYVDGLQRLAETLVKYKQIDKAPQVSQWINPSFL